MALFHSPRIVTKDLLLCVDPGSKRSYDPSENLLTYSNCNADSNGWGSTSSTTLTNLNLNALGIFNGVRVTSEVAAEWRRTASYAVSGIVSGESYSLTYFYREGTSGAARLQVRINNIESYIQGPADGSNWTIQNSAGNITNVVTELQGDNQTYKVTYTWTSNQTGSVAVGIGVGNATAGVTIIALGAQLENKVSPTDFTVTTGTAVNPSTVLSNIVNPSVSGTIFSGVIFDSENQGSLDFDGSSGYISLDGSSFDFSSEQTIMLVLKPEGLGTRQNPYNQAYGGFGTITLETGGKLNYFHGTSGLNAQPYNAASTSASLQQDEIAIATLVRDSSNLTWYINGEFDRSETNPYPFASSSEDTVLIGDGYTSNFIGKIYSCLLYDRALSLSEVQQNFNAIRGRFGL